MKRAMTRGGAPPESGVTASLSPHEHEHGRSRAAAVSIFSNTALIAVKVVAG